MNEQDIKKLIREEINKDKTQAMFNTSKVPFHVHNNLDSPPIEWSLISGAPNAFCIATNTNGTTNVNVFGTGGAPFSLTVTGVYLISKDTTAGDITVLQRANTVCTIAKGTVAGVMVGATSLSNTVYAAGDACQVDSSTAGNATVFITFTR